MERGILTQLEELCDYASTYRVHGWTRKSARTRSEFLAWWGKRQDVASPTCLHLDAEEDGNRPVPVEGLADYFLVSADSADGAGNARED